ncbi:MAG: flagellar assembly protein FliW [Candidatus Scalindua sp. AMX11]|nr:MAG: flagellar assembly protein FliW [Candidatus Scalindua sp.]NOG85818.1 flagellar assembly protein FliW [Planctomycetota bacterium]RZV97008.1 MAG: flagellar assembly protein FliW [Candidatus Scalindua sp. SCAELEC01]TDE66380.1 MAG: flagellar assembly protein FliW [Candidatus Scalindua sp. AMX11]GJQ58229.1 MAG: flagellar assembly factor FliW [Candidatus Scalindua sp.]
MIIKTRLFGEIKISKKEIITFIVPILGFHDYRQFILIEKETAFPTFWLQSVEDPKLAFPVVSPFSVDENYSIKLSSQDCEDIHVREVDETLVLTLLVVPQDILSIRTNLRAPIVYNPQKKLAKQIVLQEEKYAIHYYIMDNRN